MKRFLIVGMLGLTLVAPPHAVVAKKASSVRSPANRLTSPQKAALAKSLRALRRLSAATSANLSASQYSERFIDAKVEVMENLANVPTGKSKTLTLKALNCYQDANDLWNAFLRNNGQDCERILRKYFPDPNVFELDSDGNTTPRPALDEIWRIGAQRTEAAAASITQPQ